MRRQGWEERCFPSSLEKVSWSSAGTIGLGIREGVSEQESGPFSLHPPTCYTGRTDPSAEQLE